MTRSLLALLTSFLISLSGCFGIAGQPMTPVEISMNGTHKFNAPVEKVFDATVAALASEGYEVAVANKEKRLIKTKRKVVATSAHGGNGYATAINYTRQYTVRISETAGGASVEAVPSVYQGEADLSAGQVWLFDGPAGERTLWKRLFQAIEDAL